MREATPTPDEAVEAKLEGTSAGAMDVWETPENGRPITSGVGHNRIAQRGDAWNDGLGYERLPATQVAGGRGCLILRQTSP
jgi:hypothetical protein